ncbi:MAG TPA: hypothetical protein VK092_04265, partial [Deinococcales bacterium]|nr:hypothetical protein [Deinococcales bacterium]
AVVAPLDASSVTRIDLAAPLAASVMLLLSVYTFRGRRINRADGAVFLLLYTAYIAYLVLH